MALLRGGPCLMYLAMPLRILVARQPTVGEVYEHTEKSQPFRCRLSWGWVHHQKQANPAPAYAPAARHPEAKPEPAPESQVISWSEEANITPMRSRVRRTNCLHGLGRGARRPLLKAFEVSESQHDMVCYHEWILHSNVPRHNSHALQSIFTIKLDVWIVAR